MSETWLAALERELGPGALLAPVAPGASDPVEAGSEARDVPCVAPRSSEEWTAALRVAAEADLRVVPVGRGSKRGWCRPAERVDLYLSTVRDAGVVSYEPGDGTVSARAGTTMADLAAAVREGNHHLTPDVPRPEAATLGGVVAAGQSGFDRLRYGPVRNALLGARVMLADGRVARSGGQLVKNVTGYDLHRLYCGSHGTLCVVLEASLRLHPLPEEHAVLQAPAAGLAEAFEAARAALAIPARHLAVWCRDLAGGEWGVSVALCGRREVVEDEAERIAVALGDCETLRGDAARSGITEERDRVLQGGWPALELTARRSQLQHALELVQDAARDLGLAPRIVAHPGVAQAFVGLAGVDADTGAALAGVLEQLHARVAWRAMPPGLAAAVDPSGMPSPGLPLMRELRAALDPAGLFAAGRIHGGL